MGLYIYCPMLLERYYDDSLAQASYLIGCERTGEAIVIDPNALMADFDHHMRIRYVTETHIHADFLSGSRLLARKHKAKLLLSAHGGKDWSYATTPADNVQPIRDGDSIQIGKVRIDVIHTPGHTPEHVSFLVTDMAAGDKPMGLISGDFIFVGDVGRPDLLEKAAKVAGTMESSAKQLYASLQRTKSLPDYLQIWPGHGAGSACGKALGSVPSSTLGYERLFNPAFQQKDEASFVKWVLADQPEPPPYFAVMKHRNRDGWEAPANDAGPRLPAGEALLKAIADGDQVLDVRGSRDFGAAHVPGSINIPGRSKSFATYAGNVLSYETPIVLVAEPADLAARATENLARIGLVVSGIARPDGFKAALALRSASLKTVDAKTLASRIEANGLRVIDVRGQSEWNDGHLPKAHHVFLGGLAAHMASLKKDEPIVVHCESGTRSSLAASLLLRAGFTDVTNFAGGYAAWVKAGLPTEKD
jgi:hydroxyacylglutathione hydrolase